MRNPRRDAPALHGRPSRANRGRGGVMATLGAATDSGARLLAEARFQHRRLRELPAGARPKTAQEAYACQDALISRLIEHYGGETIGYKIACTNKIAQD